MPGAAPGILILERKSLAPQRHANMQFFQLLVGDGGRRNDQGDGAAELRVEGERKEEEDSGGTHRKMAGRSGAKRIEQAPGFAGGAMPGQVFPGAGRRQPALGQTAVCRETVAPARPTWMPWLRRASCMACA